MLTWLIRSACTRRESSRPSVIVQVPLLPITAIASAYEHSPARLLRRGRGRGLVHTSGAHDRDRAALALAAHPRARERAQRTPDRTAPARDRAHAGRPSPPARGARGGAS